VLHLPGLATKFSPSLFFAPFYLKSYPCGLWTTFHTLVATATASQGAAAGMDVLQAIRGYVKTFFGCRTCAGHFIVVATNMEPEVSVLGNNGPTLWLWEAHNKANKRIGR
jgi:thiol oxidase